MSSTLPRTASSASTPSLSMCYQHDNVFISSLTMLHRTNAPWGLQRISQAAKLSSTSTTALTYSYTYDDTAGTGVDIYIVGKSPYRVCCEQLAQHMITIKTPAFSPLTYVVAVSFMVPVHSPCPIPSRSSVVVRSGARPSVATL